MKLLVGLVIAAVVVVGLVALVVNDEAPDSRAANIEHFGLSDDPFLGEQAAPWVLVGFESPHCSSCQGFHNQILPDLKNGLIADGFVVYYYAQSTWGHDQDYDAGIAQECVYKYGGNQAFWDYTDEIYTRDVYQPFDLQSDMRNVAATHSLDEQELIECLDGETSKRVSSDFRAARDAGAKGTPYFLAFGPTGEAVSLSPNQLIPFLSDAVRA